MKRHAFTLIELLVVVAIIAILVGILLPSLKGAREAGRAVVCQAHQRGVMLAFAVYETDNKGFMPGPNTSGLNLHRGGAYERGRSTPTQDWDLYSPILGDSMNFPEGLEQKFQEICMTKLRCPSNTLTYGGVWGSGPTLPMVNEGKGHPIVVSYVTPAYFHLYPSHITAVNGQSVESLPGGEPITLPRSYAPRIELIGTLASKKVAIVEGTRYWDRARQFFDYTVLTNASGLIGSPQGNFTSRGPAFMDPNESEPYFREANRGYKPSARMKAAALRHSDKMNAAMFDGHVESLNNVQSSDPSLFAPTRSRVASPLNTWHFFLGSVTSPLKQPNAEIP